MSRTPPVDKLRRRYLRVPSIIPVDYQLLSPKGEPLDSEIRTAFTRDLGKGGLCLRVRSVPAGLEDLSNGAATSHRITVDLALPSRTLRVPGRIVWSRPPEFPDQAGKLLGVEFSSIGDEDVNAIMDYARAAARRPKIRRAVIAGLCLLALVSLALYAWSNAAHRREMTQAQARLHRSQTKVVVASDQAGDAQVELRWLTLQVEEMIENLETGKTGTDPMSKENRPAIEELAAKIRKLNQLVAKREK